jgi:murein DD-endopeptidase MepM/ murein hydrolase activator NlpD
VRTIYAHLTSIANQVGTSTPLAAGMSVTHGQNLGLSGSTGADCATGDHLHLSATMAWDPGWDGASFFNSMHWLEVRGVTFTAAEGG